MGAGPLGGAGLTWEKVGREDGSGAGDLPPLAVISACRGTLSASPERTITELTLWDAFTFTFTHLADAFVQSVVQGSTVYFLAMGEC